MTLHCTLLFRYFFRLFVCHCFNQSTLYFILLLPFADFLLFEIILQIAKAYGQWESKLSVIVIKRSNTCMSDAIHALPEGGGVSISVEGYIQLSACTKRDHSKLSSTGTKLEMTSQGLNKVLLSLKVIFAYTARLIH